MAKELILNDQTISHVFDTYFKAVLTTHHFPKETILINEVLLYELAYQALDTIKRDYLYPDRGTKDDDAIRESITLFKTKTLNFKQHITPLINQHVPSLIMRDLPTDFNNDTLKDQIHAYRIKPGDNPQDGLFNFLSSLVMMYRTKLNQQPLTVFLERLSKDDYLHKRLKARLRDSAEQATGEHWGSGNHEWLPCHLIKSILERSAGMHNGYESVVIQPQAHTVQIMDWLTLHRDFRSEVKRIYFLNEDQTIASGHVPAVRDKLEGHPNEGSKTEGTKAYHEQLVRAFKEKKSLRDFVRQCRHIEKQYLVRGKKQIKASSHAFFTVEGRRTNHQSSMSSLRHKKVKTAYRTRKALMSSLENKTTQPGVLPRVDSIISTNSEISDLLSPHSQQATINQLSEDESKDQDELSKTESYSLYSQSPSLSPVVSEPSLDAVPQDIQIPVPETALSEHEELMASILMGTLRGLQMDDAFIKTIHAILTQSHTMTLDTHLTDAMKKTFIQMLHKLYIEDTPPLPADDPLLNFASTLPYHLIIKVWENALAQPEPISIPLLSQFVLKVTPITDVTSELLRRTTIQTDALIPFFLSHQKLGDGREGDFHQRKHSQLNTVKDISRLIEESRNHCKLYDNSQTTHPIAEYFDIRSAYQALYTAISSPSERYTRKLNQLSCCCPCFFNPHAPRAHLSRLALTHLKLTKTAFIETVINLMLHCPKDQKKNLVQQIKKDIQLDDHFINHYRKRHGPRYFSRQHTRARRTLSRQLDVLETEVDLAFSKHTEVKSFQSKR